MGGPAGNTAHPGRATIQPLRNPAELLAETTQDTGVVVLLSGRRINA